MSAGTPCCNPRVRQSPAARWTPQDLSRLADAARLLSTTPEDFAADLLETMLGSGAIQIQDGRLRAAAEHSHVPAEALQAPFPRAWPPARSIPSSQMQDRS